MRKTLVSGIAILVVVPAIAAVGDTTFTANQTVANSCVIGVTGVDSGTASTTVQWTTLTYSCAAGTYLPDGDTWTSDSQYTSGNCAQCTAGNYCAGSGNGTFTYSEASDQGIISCSGTYPNSDAGSDSADDCYRACAAGDVAHLKSGGTATGRYYSTGTNLCAPADSSQCATGYHYTAGLDLVTAIGVTETGTGYGYKSNNGISVSNMSAFGLTENGTWGTNYGTGKGMVKGKSQCTSQSGTNNSSTWSNPTISQTLPSTRGGYCYCQLTEYTPDGGSAQLLSAPWVYRDNLLGAGNCEDSCATSCAQYMYSSTTSSLAFRNAMLSSVPANPATCDANTISINWKDAFGDTFEMGSCTYDGPITTPTNAPTKRGHTFGGWSFIQ